METRRIILDNRASLPPCDAALIALHQYWRSLWPGQETLPGRKHFNPAEVAQLLPLLWLVDVNREPLRFKYRLIGSIHVEAGGWNATGRWLDEAHPRFTTSSAFPQFRIVAEDGKIAYYGGPPTYVIAKDHVAIERLILPLAADGRAVDMVLGITVLHSASDLGSDTA